MDVSSVSRKQMKKTVSIKDNQHCNRLEQISRAMTSSPGTEKRATILKGGVRVWKEALW